MIKQQSNESQIQILLESMLLRSSQLNPLTIFFSPGDADALESRSSPTCPIFLMRLRTSYCEIFFWPWSILFLFLDWQGSISGLRTSAEFQLPSFPCYFRLFPTLGKCPCCLQIVLSRSLSANLEEKTSQHQKQKSGSFSSRLFSLFSPLLTAGRPRDIAAACFSLFLVRLLYGSTPQSLKELSSF